MVPLSSILLLWLHLPGTLSTEMDECSAEDGTCKVEKLCGVQGCSRKVSIYDNGGGSAQAYKPGAPVKSQVCAASTDTKYKVATWPWSRGSTTGGAPPLFVSVNLWTCAPVVNKNEQCCCTPLSSGTNAKLEVWQARPDGSYSSISPGRQDGDCRATVPVEDGKASFGTVAPGSSGSLGGLGPSGWDWMPYGPPVVHMLISANDHDPALLHVPILMDRKKFEQKSFRGSDWRGAGYFANKGERGYEITQWTPIMESGGGSQPSFVQVNMNVFLTQSQRINGAVADALCQSTFNGLPSAFFIEPIAVCAPSMLDFFSL